MNAYCPSCKQPILRMLGDAADVSFALGGPTLKCIVFKCPDCAAVLGAQVDPLAVRNEIINGVVAKLADR